MQEINDIKVVFPRYVPYFLTGDELLLKNSEMHTITASTCEEMKIYRQF